MRRGASIASAHGVITTVREGGARYGATRSAHRPVRRLSPRGCDLMGSADGAQAAPRPPPALRTIGGCKRGGGPGLQPAVKAGGVIGLLSWHEEMSIREHERSDRCARSQAEMYASISVVCVLCVFRENNPG